MDRDRTYLLDILESARLAVSYVASQTQDEFLGDVQCQDSVIRRLEIMGEAARRVSVETRSAHPDLPWSDMIGMRNILAHEYDDVDLAIVWRTVLTQLPGIVARLESLLA